MLVSPKHANHKRELSGAEPHSTNNRMELMAAIQALRALKRPCQVRLVTDSKYLKNGFTEGWLEKWKSNGWRTSDRKPVQNSDLWEELDRLAGVHAITWEWVRGHAGHPENSRADALAVAAREKLRDQVGS